MQAAAALTYRPSRSPASTAPMPTPMLAPSVGVRCNATVTPSPVDALPDELGVGLGDGVPLPDADALGVGSTVGPDDEVDGEGRPTDGDTVTSTTRGERPPETPATGTDGVGFARDDGDGTTGPTVTVTTGAGPAATAGNAGSSHAYKPAPSPATPTAYNDRSNPCRRSAAITDDEG